MFNHQEPRPCVSNKLILYRVDTYSEFIRIIKLSNLTASHLRQFQSQYDRVFLQNLRIEVFKDSEFLFDKEKLGIIIVLQIFLDMREMLPEFLGKYVQGNWFLCLELVLHLNELHSFCQETSLWILYEKVKVIQNQILNFLFRKGLLFKLLECEVPQANHKESIKKSCFLAVLFSLFIRFDYRSVFSQVYYHLEVLLGLL